MRQSLSDGSIDDILERFDQTAPHLQRRIIARFIEDREILLEAAKRAAEAAGKDWLSAQLLLIEAIAMVTVPNKAER